MTTLIGRARDANPKLAFIHIVEPRFDCIIDSGLDDENRTQSNRVLQEAWGDHPYIVAGGATADKTVER